MNQANQQVVVQSANMQLISIRQAEIAYFYAFFSNFGFQSTIVVGCTMVPTWDANVDKFWVAIYWLSSAACLASSLHVLICTVFINVFGEGLALRGPEGSMIRSVEGMIVEQNQVIISFAFTAAMFGVQMIGLFWVIMSQPTAIACSLGMLLGMLAWYHYCLRVFNGFKTARFADSRWQQSHEADEQSQRFRELDPDQVAVPLDPAIAKQLAQHQQPPSSSSSSSPSSSSSSPVTDIRHSGLLSVQSPQQQQGWQRLFCVVRGAPQSLQLLLYSHREAFLHRPGSPLVRPLAVSPAGCQAGPDQMSFRLAPASLWLFRCDTASEMTAWQAALTPQEL